MPYDLPEQPRWWKGFTLPVSVSIFSVFIAASSLWLTRYTSQISQMAYLAYDFEVRNPEEAIRQLYSGGGDTITLAWTATVRNVGNTPAMQVQLTMRGEKAKDFIPKEDITGPDYFDIAPKDSGPFHGVTTFVGKPSRSSTGDPVVAVRIAGSARYNDVFHNAHVDRVCFAILLYGTKKILTAPCQLR